MLRNVIAALFGFVLLAFIILWIIGGGPRKLWGAFSSSFQNATATSSEEFRLPWQPAGLFPTVNDEDLFGANLNPDGSPNEIEELQEEYDNLTKTADELATFGNPSPHFRKIRISPFAGDPQSPDATEEYLTIESAIGNSENISLAGWSLQSAVSGRRIFLPEAASPLRAGAVNSTFPVSLAPGQSALVLSGRSPVGGSFRENRCTGFLTQFQSFYPALNAQCPSPETLLPLTAENITTYGDECIDFMQTIGTCSFPETLPESLPVVCRQFLRDTLSHNGCVDRLQTDASFNLDVWRLYLDSPEELWRNGHDVIRLLDEKGQTVDVYTY